MTDDERLSRLLQRFILSSDVYANYTGGVGSDITLDGTLRLLPDELAALRRLAPLPPPPTKPTTRLVVVEQPSGVGVQVEVDVEAD
jgi:hypothetical protein